MRNKKTQKGSMCPLRLRFFVFAQSGKKICGFEARVPLDDKLSILSLSEIPSGGVNKLFLMVAYALFDNIYELLRFRCAIELNPFIDDTNDAACEKFKLIHSFVLLGYKLRDGGV